MNTQLKGLRLAVVSYLFLSRLTFFNFLWTKKKAATMILSLTNLMTHIGWLQWLHEVVTAANPGPNSSSTSFFAMLLGTFLSPSMAYLY